MQSLNETDIRTIVREAIVDAGSAPGVDVIRDVDRILAAAAKGPDGLKAFGPAPSHSKARPIGERGRIRGTVWNERAVTVTIRGAMSHMPSVGGDREIFSFEDDKTEETTLHNSVSITVDPAGNHATVDVAASARWDNYGGLDRTVYDGPWKPRTVANAVKKAMAALAQHTGRYKLVDDVG